MMNTSKKIFNLLFFLYFVAIIHDVEFVKQYNIYFMIGILFFLMFDVYEYISELNYTVIIKKNVIKINTKNINWKNILNTILLIILLWIFGKKILEEIFLFNSPLFSNLFLIITIFLSIFPIYKKVVIDHNGIETNYLFKNKIEFENIKSYQFNIETFEIETNTDVYNYNINRISQDEIKQINTILQKYIDFEQQKKSKY